MQRSVPLASAGFQDVGSIHRTAAGRAGADDGVDLVDEQDRIFERIEFGQHLFQPFLEVAPIARPRQQRSHVERVNGRVSQHLGHAALDDLARQALGDCRFADTGIAHIERVVLGPPAENLDCPLDFELTSDQRVDLAGNPPFR